MTREGEEGRGRERERKGRGKRDGREGLMGLDTFMSTILIVFVDLIIYHGRSEGIW